MDGSIYPDGKTLLLSISQSDIGRFLDRLGHDCEPLQFLRELTQNSIEAIQRTNEAVGEILWDVDWTHFDQEGVYKLCITDTGDGMNGPDIITYVNQLSSSISDQSVSDNYGVGAKIAAATRNHIGLIYMSWQHGSGTLATLWRDPKRGQYGLKQIKIAEGVYDHYETIADDYKPELIKDHGTKIVLMGNSYEEDTMRGPNKVPSPSRWIAKYLNSRYFRFPDGITIKAREGWMNPRSNTNNNSLRTIVGQEQFLKQYMASCGTVALTDATAHWWILRDEDAIGQNSGHFESAGHIAALYQDELYDR